MLMSMMILMIIFMIIMGVLTTLTNHLKEMEMMTTTMMAPTWLQLHPWKAMGTTMTTMVDMTMLQQLKRCII
ncbi:hypothetical protein Patl1_13156 [Pistacia atlantica]|uniref:Uncharacterized protein n=1 Tax=Pistacia atlantica TaxID=434234 RepID=A0ACC1AT88_9ROSI|nr:hypothetical protein Patl1_13156 [Pistacia atlantica]